jgi:hypothetical protein
MGKLARMPYKDPARERKHRHEYYEIHKKEILEHGREYLGRPEVREHKKEVAKRYCEIPEIRESKIEYLRNYRKLPRVIENSKKRNKERRKDSEYLGHMKVYLYEYKRRPDVVERMNDPESVHHRREYHRKYAQQRRKTDIEFRLMKQLREHVGRLVRYGYRKNGDTKKILGCSIGFLINHLSEQFSPGMSWDNYGTKWEIDHIIPLVWFSGLIENPEWQGVACHWSNLQPLWISDNRSKGAR